MSLKPELHVSTSRGFPAWLHANKVSIVFTTYQGGRVFFLGLGADGRPAAYGSSYARCMGVAVSSDARTLMIATETQIYRFDNVLQNAEQKGPHDALFAPHQTWITGDVDAHELGIGRDGLPVFANTLFNCLATVTPGYSFRPVWRPPFISRLIAEDRCHLNGIAFDGGKPKYVTCISGTDVVDGWRDHRADGGIVVDVRSGEIIADGLSMPHSPRLRDGTLWLLNSGTGELGSIDTKTGRFDPIAFCSGYARGLSFVGDYAIVGLSRARQNRTFQGLELETALEQKGVTARCGLLVIDLRDGHVSDWLRIEGTIDELFDVALLPGLRCPGVIGLSGNEIRRTFALPAARG